MDWPCMPEASLSVGEGLSVALCESLLTGQVDIALLYNAVQMTEVELTPLLEEQLFVVQRRTGKPIPAAKARAIPLREVAGLPLVIPSRPNAIRMLVETEMAHLGFRPQVAVEIDGVAAILDLVEDGAGSAILPRNAVATAARPQAFVTRPISAPRLHSKLTMAMSSRRAATLTQNAMVPLIRQIALKLLAK